MASKVYERSSTYRSVYFKHNKGIFHKWYLCPYCRKKFLQKDIVEVDHIVAVNIVKHSFFFRFLFRLLGKDVNSIMNLVAACRDCNRTKSDKGGHWIIRGATGSLLHLSLQQFSIALEDTLKKYWYVILAILIGGILSLMYVFWKLGGM